MSRRDDGPTDPWGFSPIDAEGEIVDAAPMTPTPPAPIDPPPPAPLPPPDAPGGERPAPDATGTSHAPRTTAGLVVAAIAAALAMQLVALFMLYAAFLVVAYAAFSDLFGTGEDHWWEVLAFPLAISAVAVFVWSGDVARRIAGDRRAWWVLAVGPMLLVLAGALFAQ